MVQASLVALLGAISGAAAVRNLQVGPFVPNFVLTENTQAGSGPYSAASIRSHTAPLSLTLTSAQSYRVDPSLPRHTIFAPTNPPANLKLPVLVWGQTGCTNNGTVFRLFLEELASHGVFIISNGTPNGPGNPNGIAETTNPNATLHKEGIDWVSKVAGTPGNYSAVDASRLAVAGQSCGGTQAYAIVNKDPRITAIGIFNSGMINATDTTPDSVKVPIFFFLGGPTDIAYANVSFSPLCWWSWLDVDGG